jgi:hypothetical protein
VVHLGHRLDDGRRPVAVGPLHGRNPLGERRRGPAPVGRGPDDRAKIHVYRSRQQINVIMAPLTPLLSVLPSYTQLGMAALLPQQTLEISADGRTVLVDGKSSVGTENRKKILDAALPGRATAIRADALLGMSRDESRALVRDHDVVYVYHNRIDATVALFVLGRCRPRYPSQA